jgi:uracil-DNA glycosylase
MTNPVPPSGPCPARVMIVGEAPGTEEEIQGRPFVGTSGYELTKMLGAAGINREECFITNVSRHRPPFNDLSQWIAKSKKDITSAHKFVRDKWVLPQISDGITLLKEEIARVRPNIIIALGNTALWALTGHWGISKWRGSLLYEDCTASHFKVVPTTHPAAVLRDWSQRPATITDIRRAARYMGGGGYPDPQWKFLVRPTSSNVLAVLSSLCLRLEGGEALVLALDIETRLGHISCIGLAWSLQDAMCIPLMATGHRGGYYSEEEECTIQWNLYLLLTHKNVRVVGQNLLYDLQYFERWLHYSPRVVFDTMIGQHALFSALPKSLAFLSSLYCKYYVYWKDEGKEWRGSGDESQLWLYNCRDCVYTLEVYYELVRVTEAMHATEIQDTQQLLFWPVLEAMKRGLKVDLERRSQLQKEVHEEVQKRKDFLKAVLGHSLNPASPKQMKALFYNDLRLPVQMTRAQKGEPGHVTLGDEALKTLCIKQPIVQPLIQAIGDIRTLSIFLSSFIEAKLDWDQRMRSSYNIGGSASGKSAPKTYRISSSANAFGGGANLQTVPSKKSKSIGKAKIRGALGLLGNKYSLPNLRRMFVPDPGKTFFDGDFDRADLQVVAWEANDALLKAALRMGVDIHLLNTYTLDGKEAPPLEELVETHPRYDYHRGPRTTAREFAKVYCHATNYVGSSRTVAVHTGRTVQEIERATRRWFGDHPGIPAWHKRVQDMVVRRRCVENRFGYKWHIFDRTDNILPEAVAWIPQSTVSIALNRIWLEYYFHVPEVEVLLQVHDSLAGQMPTQRVEELLPRLRSLSRIRIPYEDPLVIPFNIRVSEESWGDC